VSETDSRLRIALVQLASSPDRGENLRRLEQVEVPPADVVVLPEVFQRELGPSKGPVGADAETLDGPFVRALVGRAARSGGTWVAGMLERGEDPERPYNTLVAVDAGGVLASYRKIHLYDSFGFRESDTLGAGATRPVVAHVRGVPVGLMTCYDLRFPELGRALVDAGAQVLAVPAAWVAGERKAKHWTTLLRARAIENLVYVIGAAQCGPRYTGHSMVVSPTGDEIVEADNGETVLHVSLDLAEVAMAREANPSLANRRL